MYVLTIRFKKGTQEIRFQRKPEVDVMNFVGRSCVYINGKPYVRFIVECEDWEG